MSRRLSREECWEQAQRDKMNAPRIYNGGDKCASCWGRGWTVHYALTCQNCTGSGKERSR